MLGRQGRCNPYRQWPEKGRLVWRHMDSQACRNLLVWRWLFGPQFGPKQERRRPAERNRGRSARYLARLKPPQALDFLGRERAEELVENGLQIDDLTSTPYAVSHVRLAESSLGRSI